MRKVLLTAIILFSTAAAGVAGVYGSAATGFPLLDMGVGARAAGIGDAFTAAADDPSAAYWNPAGLAGIRQGAVSLTYDKWFMDTYYQHLLAAIPLAAGTLGVDIFYMSFGTFEKIDDKAVLTGGTIAPMDIAALVSYGFNVGGGLSIGVAAKFMNQSLGTVSGTAFAADLSAMYKAGIILAGVNIQNLGTGGDVSLPTGVRAGLGILAINAAPQNKLLVEVDFKFQANAPISLNAGLEYVLMEVFSLRAGYKYTMEESNLQGLSGITAGAGIKLGGFNIDYAYAPFGDLGTTHRVTLGLVFAGSAAAVVEKIEKTGKTAGSGKTAGGVLDAVDIYNEGAALENAGQPQEAMAKYQNALKLNSKYAPAIKRLGIMHYKQNESAKALKYFKEYIKLVPNDDQVILLIEKLDNPW